MNDHTPTDDEAEIDFGTAKYDFYWLIYNMRVSYPESSILLALADIKACFRLPRIHPDLTGAFGILDQQFILLGSCYGIWFKSLYICGNHSQNASM